MVVENTQKIAVCVDAIIDMGAGLIVLVERKNEPNGWALPGGFVEEGEGLEDAVLREIKEETSLDIEIVRQFHTYSDPKRDPRMQSVSTVFVARGKGNPKAASDAKSVELYHQFNLPENIAFDHRQILNDYFLGRY
ncbi:MAG: NUDIX hydrolase [Bdellovibrionota bacterium]